MSDFCFKIDTYVKYHACYLQPCFQKNVWILCKTLIERKCVYLQNIETPCLISTKNSTKTTYEILKLRNFIIFENDILI